MAKSKTNKSQAIRDHFKANRKATAPEVVAALKEQGITVTEGLVYNVKGKIKGRRKRRLKAEAVATKNIRSNSHVDPVTLVKQARELAHQAGGIKKLKELLEALE
jgi:hypothetical protein